MFRPRRPTLEDRFGPAGGAAPPAERRFRLVDGPVSDGPSLAARFPGGADLRLRGIICIHTVFVFAGLAIRFNLCHNDSAARFCSSLRRIAHFLHNPALVAGITV